MSEGRGSGGGWAILAALVIASAAAGAWYFQRAPAEAPVATAGFDLNQAEDGRKAAPIASTPKEPSSSLGMVKSGLPGMHFGTSNNAAPAREQAAGSFANLCRANERKVREFSQAYTRKYPAIAQYGRDWMSYPDLKRLNDDYMRDHDPAKFLRGLAASRNFGLMVKKYARDPAIQAFVKDGLRQTPSTLLTAGMAYLNEDGLVKGLVDNVARSLGLPPGLFGGSKVDSQAAMDSILKNNPQLQSGPGR